MTANQKKTATDSGTKSVIVKPPSKSEVMNFIADDAGLSKKEITAVFDSLKKLMEKNLGDSGPGLFTIPGLVKIRVIKKPATKARSGINPFTGEETVFKAKPARKVIKALALKGLKETV